MSVTEKTVHEPFVAEEMEPGVMAGPVRRPRNLEQAIAGSIHEDTTAQRLGLRGGTVAGSLHMEQFPPLLTHVLGDGWWERGSLSLYFRYATTDLEPVRCFCRRPPTGGGDDGVQTEVWMDHENGTRVAEGTASVGDCEATTALEERLRKVPSAEDLRILAGLEEGTELGGIPVRVPQSDLDRRLEVIVEPLPAYTGGGDFGGAVLPPSLMVRAMTAFHPKLLEGNENLGVGLYGAIEIRSLAGPVFVEQDYEVRGKVLAVGETPKTEYFWYESILADPDGRTDRAAMIMMLRFMKASSPLWQ